MYRRTSAVEAREQLTRQSILAAAVALVGQRGLTSTGIADVADEAGVAVGTVYRHFASKTDLVCEVLRQTCRHELDVVDAIASDQAVGATERLEGAVAVFTRRALESGRMAHSTIVEPTFAEAEQLRLDIRRELAGIFSAIVATGIADGEFQEQSADLVGIALVGAMSEVLVGRLTRRTDAEVDALVEQLTQFARNAVGVTPRRSIEAVS